MIAHIKQSLPLHWRQSRPYCLFSPPTPIRFGQGEKILLVEKDQGLLKLGKTLLEKLRYTAFTARTDQEMLARCRTEQFDLIIIDDTLPGCSDPELRSAIRQMQGSARILISSAQERFTDEADEDSRQQVLTKPFTVNSFSQTLHRHLKSSH